MGNDEYGPPPSGQPLGHGEPPPGAYPPNAYPPNAYPPNAYPPGTPPQAAYPTAFPPPYPPAYAPPFGGTRTDRNWMGITSLILGLVLPGLLGLAFGIGGIMAAKEGRANNRTLAIWGVVANIVMSIIVIGSFVALGVFGGALSGDRVPYPDLAVGDCIQKPAGWDDLASDLEAVDSKRVSCEKQHWGQVYHVGLLTGGNEYPGDADVLARTEDMCVSDSAAANLTPEHLDDVYISYIMPSESSWADGGRNVICFVSNQDYDLAESWVVVPQST